MILIKKKKYLERNISMTVYEPEDFNKIWDSKWMRFNRSVNKLKKMRTKINKDNKLKEKTGAPTSIELEKWFYYD